MSALSLFPTQALTNTSFKYDYAGGINPVYIGLAAAGSATSAGVWQIKKISYDNNGNPTSILYAGGDAAFENIWDNRASYSYS